MAEIENKDIIELENETGTTIYPKTTGEAVYIRPNENSDVVEALQTFLTKLHEALRYDIIPANDEAISIGTSEKKLKEIHVLKIVVSGNIEAAGQTLNIGTVKAAGITATGEISGSAVKGAVFN